ncbi:potassium channel family protein [Rathayibacter sp. CAU 1779]
MSGRSERLDARERAVARWEEASSWPFLVLSLVFIVAYSIRCLDPMFIAHSPVLIWSILIAVWAIFVVDYVGRLLLSPHKWSFVRHNVPDLLGALLPVFRPFRALRELRRIRYFRQRTGAAVRARLVASAVTFVVLWVYVIAVTEVLVERGAKGATIVSLGDALYWAVVTIATVGYGDMVPVTTMGRTLAVALMLSGIIIVGVTTATVVSYLNDAVHTHRKGDAAPTDGSGTDPERHA